MINLLHFPTSSETTRLHLRPLRGGDIGSLWKLTNDPSIATAISFLRFPLELADAAALIDSQASGRDFFIGAWKRNAVLVGVVGAHRTAMQQIEIGYWIGTAFQGWGYATEAVSSVVAALKTANPESEIIAECHPENTGSRNVLMKLGFCPTGRPGLREGREVFRFYYPDGQVRSPLPSP